MVPGAIFASTVRTKAFGVGMNSDGRRIFDIAEVCVIVVKKNNSGEYWRRRTETHDVIRVDVLDYDTLVRQLGRETLGPHSEERLAGGVDGEHWGRRCACERAHVHDQALLTDDGVR